MTLPLLILDSPEADPDGWQEALTPASRRLATVIAATDEARSAALRDPLCALCLCAPDADPELLRRLRDLALPWIAVTPGIDPRQALECLRAGAADCVVASDLGPAVDRMLDQGRRRWRAERRRTTEEIARFAARAAHDMNNLLTIIHGYGDLLVQDLAQMPEELQTAQELVDAAQRTSSLTARLTILGRGASPAAQALELEGFLAGRKAAWAASLTDAIEVSTRVEEPGMTAWVPGVDLERILLELLRNAAEAMPQGGRLEIVAREPQESGLPSELAAGDYAQILVADHGTGVPEELRPRVFEPFVTTKPKQNGAGLGLAIVDRLVAQSGGAVTLASSARGTTVAVYLPRPKP